MEDSDPVIITKNGKPFDALTAPASAPPPPSQADRIEAMLAAMLNAQNLPLPGGTAGVAQRVSAANSGIKAKP